uniref:Orotidine 5'-phosphate decarboxylase n=1 Tax=candidate division WOR-3 bacterium TaxID=2052148 RepID=A0A7V0Z448_UNCW3
MSERLIVALDSNDINKIKMLVDRLQNVVKYFKVGAIPFTCFGPEIIRFLKERGLKVMLDLKYHDIPNTVARACEGAMELGVDMLTMHTSGGFMMMEETVKAVSIVSDVKKLPKPKLLGITTLTSIDEAYFKDLFGDVKRTIEEQVVFLARLAQSAGLDGVVASPQEIESIRKYCGKDFLIVTPGIRTEGEMIDDQARTMTPARAIKAGADFIVVGRPIIAAKDPLNAAKNIIKEIENAG